MRGGAIHNRVMVERLARVLREAGTEVVLEAPVEVGPSPRCIDLLATCGSARLAIEVELTPRRVLADIEKARLAGAATLLIVTPTASVARRARRALRGQPFDSLAVVVLPLGLAAQWVTNWCSLNSEAIHPRTTNSK